MSKQDKTMEHKSAKYVSTIALQTSHDPRRWSLKIFITTIGRTHRLFKTE